MQDAATVIKDTGERDGVPNTVEKARADLPQYLACVGHLACVAQLESAEGEVQSVSRDARLAQPRPPLLPPASPRYHAVLDVALYSCVRWANGAEYVRED